jgi:hypothetical protein
MLLARPILGSLDRVLRGPALPGGLLIVVMLAQQAQILQAMVIAGDNVVDVGAAPWAALT